jgi:hypothetical protein
MHADLRILSARHFRAADKKRAPSQQTKTTDSANSGGKHAKDAIEPHWPIKTQMPPTAILFKIHAAHGKVNDPLNGKPVRVSFANRAA